MLLIALMFVLGVCVTAEETGLFLNVTAGVLACGIFFHGIRTKKMKRGAAALLFLILIIGGLRYRLSKGTTDKNRETIQSFGNLRVVLRGVVDNHSSSDKSERLVIKDGILSSAYGSKDTLPPHADRKMLSRYEQHVGSIMVYLSSDNEPSSDLPARTGTGETLCDTTKSQNGPFPGELVEIRGTMVPLEPPKNEGEFDFPLYYKTLGINGSMYGEDYKIIGGEAEPFKKLLQDIRNSISERLDEISEGTDSGIYKALLTGNKSFMAKDIRDLYQDSGIAHILAVSGLHLSIIGSGFYGFLRRMGSTKCTAGIGGGLLILSFGIFTGCSGSAMRAVIMLLIKFLGEAIGRSYDMLSSLSLACILLLITEPCLLFSSGFQLSFMAVLALGIAAELPHPKGIYESLYMSLFLELMTLPIILFHFFRFPLYGLILNFLVLPLMSYVICSGLLAVALSFISLLLGIAALGLGHYILSLYTTLCLLAGELPFSSLLLGQPSIIGIISYYAILFSLIAMKSWIKKEKKKGLAAIRRELINYFPLFCVLTLLIGGFLLLKKAPSGLEITSVSVGQGDGFVIRADGLVITVDGGSSSDKKLSENTLIPYLESQGIESIDMAFITHCDSDHYNGIFEILKSDDTTIKELVLPLSAKNDDRYDKFRDTAEQKGTMLSYMGAGSLIETEHLTIRGLYPLNSTYISEANSHSIGMLLSYGEFDMLFTGDMDKECEYKMLDFLEDENKEAMATGAFPDIEVLKAGHHGSSTSTSEDLLKSFKPECAILSYGKDNDYGHPHRETLDLLENHKIKIYETAKLGEIRIESDGKEFRILTPMKK